MLDGFLARADEWLLLHNSAQTCEYITNWTKEFNDLNNGPRLPAKINLIKWVIQKLPGNKILGIQRVNTPLLATSHLIQPAMAPR